MKECVQSGKESREQAQRGFMESLPELLNIINEKEYLDWSKKMGIGQTPLLQVPKELVPFKDVTIHAKLEYVNFGESVKARPFSSVHYRSLKCDERKDKPSWLAATSGNFGLSGSFILKDLGEFTVYMSRKTVTENKDLIHKLEENKVKIDTFSDDYCPAAGGNRGQAIAAARLMETEFGVTNYDQYSDLANPMAHYLGTGPEIYEQMNGDVTMFLTALGTCGSIVGIGNYLKTKGPDIKVIGAVPVEGHHQIGLRSPSELGATLFFKEAEKVTDRLVDIGDKEAFENMIKMWEAGIPAGITCGTNLAGALKMAEEAETEGRSERIAILYPDSLENYEQFLKLQLPEILGVEFSRYSELFHGLREKAVQERHEFLGKERG